jgi:hypothetical protein
MARVERKSAARGSARPHGTLGNIAGVFIECSYLFWYIGGTSNCDKSSDQGALNPSDAAELFLCPIT